MIVAHTGRRSEYMTELHKRHPIIRTGPEILSYSDPLAIKDIYGHNTKCTKDTLYVVTSGTHCHLADVKDKHEHARKRKVLSSAYALKNLQDWEHKVADKTARMMKHFDKCCTAPLPEGVTIPNKQDLNLDFRVWTNFFSLDAILDIGLSETHGFLDRGHSRITARRTDGTQYECDYRDCLYQSLRKVSLLVWPYAWYRFISKLADIVPFYGRMGRFARDWDGIPLELASRRWARYQAGEKLDDFFQALMEDKNGVAHNLEWGEIVAEVSIMINAGSVTTAIALTNALLDLLKHPNAMAKVCEELDTALGEDDSPSSDDHASNLPTHAVVPYDKVKHLPYLKACLDESLRLHPPTPPALGRETPPEGCQIVNDWIPGGVTVGVSALVAHRQESVFPQADQYVPERWLGEAGKALQPYFITFSAGARGCIGRNISYLEQTVVMASVLRRYRFALAEPDWEIERVETLNWILGPMPVKVWRREQRERRGSVEMRKMVV